MSKAACGRRQSASHYNTGLLQRPRWLSRELTYEDRPGVTVILTMGLLITRDGGRLRVRGFGHVPSVCTRARVCMCIRLSECVSSEAMPSV